MENQNGAKKKWVCVTEPQPVILRLGSYQCPECQKVVIAFSESDKLMTPSIGNYKFCPYCGK